MTEFAIVAIFLLSIVWWSVDGMMQERSQKTFKSQVDSKKTAVNNRGSLKALREEQAKLKAKRLILEGEKFNKLSTVVNYNPKAGLVLLRPPPTKSIVLHGEGSQGDSFWDSNQESESVSYTLINASPNSTSSMGQEEAALNAWKQSTQKAICCFIL